MDVQLLPKLDGRRDIFHTPIGRGVVHHDAAQVADDHQIIGTHRPIAGGGMQPCIAGKCKQKSDRRAFPSFDLRLHFHTADELITTKYCCHVAKIHVLREFDNDTNRKMQ